MENNTLHITNYELLGQVLDSNRNKIARQLVLLNLTNPLFEECFMVALKATRLFDNKMERYETI